MKSILILTAGLWAASTPAMATGTASPDTVDWTGAPTVHLSDLADQAGTLPRLLIPTQELGPPLGHFGPMAGYPALAMDLDGDGTDELFKGGRSYLTPCKQAANGVYLIQDQLNFPREYSSNDGAGFALAGPFDLDGDGELEIMAIGAHPDNLVWGFWVIDPVRLAIEAHFTLAHQPERQPDGRWDGSYGVVGALPGLLDDPDRLAVVLCVNAGFDAYGRGMLAVDPWTGRTIWHFESAPNPEPRKTVVTDLDGDGQPEVVYLGRSPDNLTDGTLIGGLSDDHARLFVLDDHGRLRWSRYLEDHLNSGWLAVADLDARPGPEIVTYSGQVKAAASHLRVWSAQGDLLAACTIDDAGNGLALLPAEGQAPPDLLISTRSGLLARLRYTAGRLEPRRTTRFPSLVTLLDVIPAAGGEGALIWAKSAPNLVALLDQDFRPQGAWSGSSGVADFGLALQADSGPALVVVGSPGLGLVSRPNPDALPANPLLRALATLPYWVWGLALLAALSLGGWWWQARRHRREIAARAIIPGDGDHLREARLHLLEDLELSGHGAIAPLRSLRRLLWLLDALQTGIEFNPELATRFREIWSDCTEEALPRLLVILDRARAAHLDHPCIGIATEALLKAQVHLGQLKAGDFAAPRLAQATAPLHQCGDTAEGALQNLRQEVANLFTADLDQVLARVLRANQESIQGAGVSVARGRLAEAAAGGADLPAGRPPEPILCRIDPGELEFILDNLVGNAVRAMASAPQRRLQLAWLATNGMVKLEVGDTGVGIAAEDRDRLLDLPFSTREGGGLGLHRSARLLRKYGGQLSIKSSAPGRGTVFQLLLPRAHG